MSLIPQILRAPRNAVKDFSASGEFFPLDAESAGRHNPGMDTQLPIRDIFYRLGGPRALAERLGLKPTAVYSWKGRDSIPAGYVVRIAIWLGEPIERIRPDMVENEKDNVG